MDGARVLHRVAGLLSGAMPENTNWFAFIKA